MKKYTLALFLFVVTFANAQRTLNDYKYAVVPQKFDFLDEADKYMLNTYSKMYMEKYGFVTFFDNAVPMELANENCNKVFVDIVPNNSLLYTRLSVVIKDCTNKILFKSVEGSSKEKSFKVAYAQALRHAFASFDRMNYSYSGKDVPLVAAINPTTVTTKPISNEQAAAVITSKPASKDLLFAQPVENGYQVIDTTPKVVLRLKSTSKQDVFIAERDTITGILFNQNGNWIFEYYASGMLRSELVNIKF